MWAESRSWFGEFELIGAIAVGRDTLTWQARRANQDVALKVGRADATDPLAGARLAHEVAALSRTRGTTIPLVDAGTIGATLWLATRWCDAGDLGSLAERERGLDDTTVIAVMARVASALAAMHDVGVVHRDLKPANVFLETGGNVWLGDLGNAAIDGVAYDSWASGGSRARLVARTEGFTAPEVLAGSVIGREADVFAFGRTLTAIHRAHADTTMLDSLAEMCTRSDPGERPTMSKVTEKLAQLAPMPIAPPSAPARFVLPPTPVAPTAAGRAQELAAIHTALTGATSARETRTLLLVGPPGAGKTWLADHTIANVPGDVHITRLRCSETLNDWRVLRPLVAAIGEATLEMLGVAPLDALRQAVGFGSANAPDLLTATAALRTLLRTIAPFVLSIDDLHHADPALLALLSDLAHSEAPGLILATARTGRVDADDLDAATLTVGELDDTTQRTIAALHLGDPDEIDQAVRLAAGNPLHALEAARAIARGDTDIATSDLRDLVAARAESMHGERADALALAATCGAQTWPAIVGSPLADHAPALVRDGWLAPTLPSAFTDSPELRFAHPLLREVAYERLTELDRRVLHGRLARCFDTHDIDPEIIARHAGIAFSLGDHTLAELTARRAAASVREALDHYAVGRAADWAELLRETEREPELADVLTAEVKNRQGDFAAALELLLPLAGRTDDIGTRALMIGTESLVGTGDYQRAVEWGDRAAHRAGDATDRVRRAKALAIALRESGDLPRALDVLDGAAALARSVGENLLAVRIASDATTVAQAINQDSPGSLDSIRRARNVVAELFAIHDDSGLLELADSWVTDAIAIEDPALAVEIQCEALRLAEDRADRALAARASRRLIEVAWDAERQDAIDSALPHLVGAPVSLSEQHMFAILSDVASTVARGTDAGLGDRLLAEVHAIDAMAGAAGPDQHLALCALAYVGRAADMRAALEHFATHRPMLTLFAIMSRLNLAVLGAEAPNTVAGSVPTGTTAFNNELALLALIAGEREESNRLFTARSDFLLSTGNTHQGYAPTFAGALFSALGPPETNPRIDWVVRQIVSPVFPGMWTFQRAIVALLLAERSTSDFGQLRDHARRLRNEASPDPEVAEWFDRRLDRRS